jgi:YhcH/YjgK/YiaL family protein
MELTNRGPAGELLNHPSPRREFIRGGLALLSGSLLLPCGTPESQAGAPAEERKIMTGNLRDWRKLKGVKGLEAGFQFLERDDLATLPLGRHDIVGDSVYVILQKPRTRPPSEGKFEAHQNYIDIQCLIAGEEVIGITPVENLKVTTPYDPAKDIAFYAVPEKFGKIPLNPGQFTVLFPADGHLPLCPAGNPMEIHKAVVKVKLDYWKKFQE